MLFVACILLGRFLSRTLVAIAIFVIDRLAAVSEEEVNRGYLQSGIYYLHGKDAADVLPAGHGVNHAPPLHFFVSAVNSCTK